MQRLEDTVEISSLVKYSLGRGDECSKAWEIAIDAAEEMGHGANLMGVPPNQAKFLGHSVGLELDESPVVAKGFDRRLEFGGVMAIEPKLVFDDGAIGVEDTWARNTEGMKCLTAGEELPYLKEW